MNGKRGTAVAVAVITGVLLAGCGEREGTTIYKQGRYQGKPDAPPYDSAAFKGDRSKWEGAIRARGQHQNEYPRMGS